MPSYDLHQLPSVTGTIVLNLSPASVSQFLLHHGEDSSLISRRIIPFLRESVLAGSGLIKILLPSSSGFVVQSDILERRMVDCLDVARTQSFLVPAQHVNGYHVNEYMAMEVQQVMSRCFGAVAVQSEDASDQINEELNKRMSLPWLSPSPIPRKRIAIVGGGSLSKLKGFLDAAASLNIALVVLDEPGHWISNDLYADSRENFVSIDMSVTADLPSRFAAALSDYQNTNEERGRIDGLYTLDEHLISYVSQAAALLGLHTSPPDSIALAQNKFRTRQLDVNVYCRLVSSVKDLEQLLAEDGPRLSYPLIVKPSKGWSSEGVWKVANEQELRTRVPMLWQDAFTAWHGHDVVIETYIDGPEVDANLVLVNGELVFFEVNDDFPSPGDYDITDKDRVSTLSKAPVANFVETSNMLPSALPHDEIEALRQKLHQLVLAAGFTNGVLHLEAKLRNSSCRYTESTESDEQMDLKPIGPSKAVDMKPEDVFLIEINPRAPGWQEIEATAHAYGVSYYSLGLLNALADTARVSSLSQPFLGGAQYHLQLLFVSAHKGGVYRYGDICPTVLSQLATNAKDIKARVVKCATLMEDGQDVPDPRTGMVYGNFIAYFLIASRNDRQGAMRLGRIVENTVRVLTDGF
ncbi:hypothetical protein E0Z10_g10033 [Xylaria hypoxylon]|uniref:ATP-grasp domain-containing protein n=1 Tax=Xylaria hypoxylon TaxID=37992 RepID=A0A4Z0Y3W8_9PEZI|nr:hypothetical protein E0Z10_g10033 [Xylaria hypoxylon]